MQVDSDFQAPNLNAIIDQLGTGEWQPRNSVGTNHYFRRCIECDNGMTMGFVSRLFHTVLNDDQPKSDAFKKLYIYDPFNLPILCTIAEFGCRKEGPEPISSYDEDLGYSTYTEPVPPPSVPKEFLTQLKRDVNTYLGSLTQDWESGDKEGLKRTVLTNEYHFRQLYNDPQAEVRLNRKVVQQFADDNLRTFAVFAGLYNGIISNRLVEFQLNYNEQCLYMMGTPANIKQLFATIESSKIKDTKATS